MFRFVLCEKSQQVKKFNTQTYPLVKATLNYLMPQRFTHIKSIFAYSNAVYGYIKQAGRVIGRLGNCKAG